jgi:hypothetical protein
MLEILTTLKATPIPTLLIVAGLVFLLLGVSGGFAGKVQVPASRQRTASIIGGVLVVIGLLVNFFGSPQDARHSATGSGIAPPAAPTAAVADAPAAGRAPEPRNGLLAAARQWPLVVQDRFDADRNLWLVGEEKFKVDGDREGRLFYEIAGGRYRWQGQFPGGRFQWVRIDQQDPTTDFFATVDVKVSAVPDDSVTAGLMFRQRGEKLYACLVANTRSFSCHVLDGQWRNLVPWTRAATITAGTYNRLSVIATGPTLRVYVNDVEVGVMTDDTALSGTFGLLIDANTAGARAEVEFDNFEMRRKP